MSGKKEDKIDLVKLHKAEYASPKKPKLIDTKPGKYLAARGQGEPGSDDFQNKIGALYAMAYTAKFQSKFAGRDYTVCKLEAIYGDEDQIGQDFASLPKDQWKWKMMIRVPEFISDKHLAEARTTIRDRGKDEGFLNDVHLEEIDEGTCIQMLHVGPYDQEKATVDLMMEFAQQEGYEFTGLHHEIYLSDPRRVLPERLKTILRQPVNKT